jgi:tripeptidyl-peptidase I
MSRSFLVGASLLAQLAVPAFGAAALVSHESLASLPSGWTQVSTPDAETTVQLSVALALQNLDQLESTLQSVSTPGNASYGKYLDADDIAAQFGPANSSADAVTSWLQENGITQIYNAGQSINFATTVSKVRTNHGSMNAMRWC